VSETKAPAKRRALSPAQAFEEAVARHRAGKPVEAEQLYRAVLKLTPDHFGATHYLGLACTQRGKLEEAEALLQRAVAIEPGSVEAHTDLGIALAALRRPEEAVAQYEKAIALAPEYADAHNNLGIALQALKRHEEAAARFEAALALKPGNPFVLNNLGSALAALGRHDEAVAAYRAAIALDPRFAEAVNNLGLSLAVLDCHDEAVAHFEQAIAAKPDYAEVHGNLGAALNKLARHEEAIAHFERALELNPNLAEAHNDIGNALVALKRHEEAVERYRRALAIRPQFARAHNHLGNALALLDRHAEAIPHFEAALALDPNAGEVHASLGSALSAIDRYDQAIPHFRTALDLRPNSAQAHWQLGSALESAGRSEAAVECHLRAMAIEPTYAEAHNGLGFSLISLGRLDEGRRALERAIELAPKAGHFHRNLAMSKRFAAGDPQLPVMEELAGGMTSLDEQDQMELQFALGKAYADLGRQEEALRHLIGANALKRKRLKYDPTVALGQINRIREIFTAEFIREKSGRGQASDLPVFIVGMPRSGSTLIEQILASHPAVFGAGELPNFGQAASSLCGIPAAMPSTESLAELPSERMGELGARYLDSVGALAPDARRITDKLLVNFRMIGLIHLALPRGRIIHACRDPLDTCLSCFERHFAKNSLPFTYDLAELGRYHRAYETLMAHWRGVLPADAILDVQYEDLVADFEPQARRIIAYCGLDWDERCRAFYKTERPIHTASVVQVREPLYGSSVGRWHSVKHLLRPLLDELGIVQ
jgi:tetratricopeptide (TPR) repeat protein